jgi:hypothetical protein
LLPFGDDLRFKLCQSLQQVWFGAADGHGASFAFTLQLSHCQVAQLTHDRWVHLCFSR